MNTKSITKEFANMYGEGKPLHYTTNKSINNLLKNIPNKNFENNFTNSNNSKVDVDIDSDAFDIPYSLIITILILLFILFLIYYFRDNFINLFNPVKPDTSNNTLALQKAEQANQKIDDIIKKYENTLIQKKEDNQKIDQEKVNNGGAQQLNNKINSMSSYKQEQLSKENSYCYIGTDNGQRECASMYPGEVCMSGQIFPKMEVCVNPHLTC